VAAFDFGTFSRSRGKVRDNGARSIYNPEFSRFIAKDSGNISFGWGALDVADDTSQA
jgi:hypothetical protein